MTLSHQQPNFKCVVHLLRLTNGVLVLRLGLVTSASAPAAPGTGATVPAAATTVTVPAASASAAAARVHPATPTSALTRVPAGAAPSTPAAATVVVATVPAAAARAPTIGIQVPLLADQILDQLLSPETAEFFLPGSLDLSADEQPFCAVFFWVAGEEAEGLGDFFHVAKRGALFARDPADALFGDETLQNVLAARDVHVNLAEALLQQPPNVVPTILPLLQLSRDQRVLTDVLQVAPRSVRELDAGNAALSEHVADVLLNKTHDVAAESVVVPLAFVFAEFLGVVARGLCLHGRLHLEFSTLARGLGAQNRQHLELAHLVLAAGEKHQAPEVHLDGRQGRATRTRDVAHAVLRDFEHCAVIPVVRVVDLDRTVELREQPLHVLPQCFPLVLGSREDGRHAHVLQQTAAGLFQFPAGGALLAQREAELVVVLELHGAALPVLPIAVAFEDLLLVLLVPPRGLGLDRRQHLQLGTPPVAAVRTENRQRLNLAVTAAAAFSFVFREKHEDVPFLLDGAEKVSTLAGDETDRLVGDIHQGQVARVVFVAADGDRTFPLRHEEASVLDGAVDGVCRALRFQNQVVQGERGNAAGLADLHLRFAVLPQHEGGVIVRQLQLPADLVPALFSSVMISVALVVAAIGRAAGTRAGVGTATPTGAAVARRPGAGTGNVGTRHFERFVSGSEKIDRG
mmetsp:Transcript_28178/g.71509  ORF Transcript_28178/g.71509 Transcript_28178/m.71509 type:complete len:687 (-) Transcript_28178:783-2843(-)